MTIEEMFRELSVAGYYLVYMDSEWCFGNEFLDEDLYLLDGCSHKHKDVLIREGYLRLKQKQS